MLSVMPNGLLKPLNRFDQEHISSRYAVGSRVRAKITQPRSVPRHRLYWSVLAEVVTATGDRWCDVEDLHESVKIRLRMLRGVSMLGGGVRYVTQSISFESMDEGQFKTFFDKAMAVITEDTGIDTQAILKELTSKSETREAVA
jgi:hypothetical protein